MGAALGVFIHAASFFSTPSWNRTPRMIFAISSQPLSRRQLISASPASLKTIARVADRESQLPAILVLRQFFRTDYRGMIQLLAAPPSCAIY